MRKIIPQVIDGQVYNVAEGTGEVVNLQEPFYAETETERNQRLDIIEQKKNKELRDLHINKQYETYGNFIWTVYSMSQKNYVQLKPSSLTRLMFISTYLGYDGYLELRNHNPITKNRLKELMKLSNGEFYNFMNELVKNKILYIKDDKLFINHDLFIKGSLKSNIVGEIYTNRQAITRIYINAVRSLYNMATPRSHKTLSYIFQVMPFVNRQYNVVCFNPLEEDMDKVNAMNFGEFCDAIGYDKQHAKRLHDVMFKPKFLVKGEEKCAIKYVSDEDSKQLNNHIFVNPRVYYAGDQWEKVALLGKF